VDTLSDRIPDYARDLRLNLSTVLTPQGAPGLNPSQLWMTALAIRIRDAGRQRQQRAEQNFTPGDSRSRPLRHG
jgi:hypothetical protein